MIESPLPKPSPQNEIRYAAYLFVPCAIVHVWWGVLVLVSDKVLKTTGLYDVYGVFGNDKYLTGSVILFAGLLAAVSVLVHTRSRIWAFAMILPQQLVMLLSLITSARCIASGTFADGARYDPLFIAADQNYVFIFGAAHTALIIDLYWRSSTITAPE